MSYERLKRESQIEQRLNDELIEAIKRQTLTSFCRSHKLEQTALHRFLKKADRGMNLSTAGRLAEALGLKLGKPATKPIPEPSKEPVTNG
jgi:hypothetical protein